MTNEHNHAEGRTKESGFTLIELMIVVAIIAIVASLTVPSLIASRMTANERVAIATLRHLASCQMQFRALNYLDENFDGVPEFGTVDELTGNAPIRGIATPLSPPLITGSLTNFGADGYHQTSGYFFAMYLPDNSGNGVNPTTALASVDPDQSALFWSCLAWPTANGSSGRTTFFVNQQGQILQSLNAGYSGATSVPPPGAANLGGNTDAINTAQLAIGVAGADGNLWTTIQ